ncbi:Ig-like domain-containing protein, partial [Aporhodopirellula aestuarii]
EILGNGRFRMTATATNGQVTFNVPAAAVTDDAGNASLEATQLALNVDTVGMTPTLSSTVATLSNVASFVVAIDFAEAVTGFTLADLTVLNGVASDLVTVNASTGKYNATITPTADGNVTVLLPANAVTDAAGNGNSAAVSLVRTIDRTAPAATLTTNQPSPTNLTTFEIIAEFGETVTTLAKSGLTITGGTASDPVLLSPGRYAFTITATGSDVQMQLQSAAVKDMAGNDSLASNTLNIAVDTTALVPVLSSTSAPTLNTNTIPVSVNFGKALTQFGLNEVTVLGGTASNLTTIDAASGRYAFTVTGSSDGQVSVLIAGGVVQDAAGNRNAASGTLVRTIDRVAPRPTITANTSALSNKNVFDVSVNFGETVSGFTLSDVVAVGATLTNLQPLGDGLYRMTATAGEGNVSLNIPASAATDDANNASLAATPLTLTVDSVGVTPTLSSTVAGLSNSASFVVAIDFAEAVTGFALADLTVLNGTASNLITNDAATGKYTVTIAPIVDGSVTVLLPANAVTDAAGNGNLAATPLVRSIDRTVPTVVLTTDQPSTTNKTSFDVIAEFGEPITGLAKSDLTITGAVASDPILVSPGRYRFTITAVPGDFSLSIAAGEVTDLAGNANTASNTLSLIVDTTAIVPVVVTTAPSVVTSDSFDISIRFGTTVTSFDAADIIVAGGIVEELKEVVAETGEYTATITPIVDGAVTLSIPSGAAVDLAGNVSATSNVITRRFDRSAPSAMLSFLTLVPGQKSREVEIVFSEPVVDFNPSDLVVSGGNVDSLVRNLNDTVYRVSVTPASDGELSVELPAGRVQDAAGLGNTAAVPITTLVDISQPVPTITGAPSTTPGQFNITIEFSEAITGLTANDLQIGNAILSGLTGNANRYTATLTAINEGDITVSLPEERVIDAAGNRNVDSNVLTLVHRVVDSIVLESNGETIDMTTYDETVLATVTTIDIRGNGINSLVVDANKITRLTPNQTLIVISDRGDEITFDSGWKFDSVQIVNGLLQRVFRNGTAKVRVVGPTDWTNPILSPDVSGDGDVSAVDALRIINALNQKLVSNDAGVLVDATTVDPGLYAFYDVNGDSILSALDALVVINELNRLDSEAAREPAGELTPSVSDNLATAKWSAGDLAANKGDLAERIPTVEFISTKLAHTVEVDGDSITTEPKPLSADASTVPQDQDSSDTLESIDHVLGTIQAWQDIDR